VYILRFLFWTLVGYHCPVSAWKAFVKAGQRNSAVFFGLFAVRAASVVGVAISQKGYSSLYKGFSVLKNQ
jgi:hypothetical protein